MKLSRFAAWATWTNLVVAPFLAVMPSNAAAGTGQGTTQIQPVLQSVFALQLKYDNARARREPVTHLLANAFVEIQADGRMLTRAQAVEQYTRVDDVSAGSLSERRTASYGDVVIIAERTGEEGTPYSARRLYVWANESGAWRLLVFQKTFIRSRTAKLSPLDAVRWPTENRNEQPTIAEEQTFATRDPAILPGLLADESVLVDGYGGQLTGPAWLAQLNQAKDTPLNVRSLLLYQGEAAVVIGDEVSTPTSLVGRFTRVWMRSPQGMQLRISQTTFAAVEVFGPQR